MNLELWNWTYCETATFANSKGLIYQTGTHYRVLLEVDSEVCRALKIRKPKTLLSGNAASIEEAREKTKRADEILENMKVGVK